MEILEGLPQQHAFTTRSATNLHNDLYSEVFWKVLVHAKHPTQLYAYFLFWSSSAFRHSVGTLILLHLETRKQWNISIQCICTSTYIGECTIQSLVRRIQLARLRWQFLVFLYGEGGGGVSGHISRILFRRMDNPISFLAKIRNFLLFHDTMSKIFVNGSLTCLTTIVPWLIYTAPAMKHIGHVR